MRLICSIALTCAAFFSSVKCQAQALSARVPFLGEPVREWIVVVQSGQGRFLTADVLKSPDSLHLSAVLPGLSGEYIISGVVEFDDGRVISTPLHQPERVTLPRESSQLAHAELSRLTQERAQLEKRGSELAEESKRLRTSLRSAAGLEDVDRLYEKIAALEERLAELSALPGEGVTH